MARILFDSTKTALAFAAVVVVGAGFVAANFEGVRERAPEEPQYAIEEAEPEPAPDPDDTNGGDAYSYGSDPFADSGDDWYDDPYADTGNGGPLGGPDDTSPVPNQAVEPVPQDGAIPDDSGAGYEADYPNDY